MRINSSKLCVVDLLQLETPRCVKHLFQFITAIIFMFVAFVHARTIINHRCIVEHTKQKSDLYF